jgi:uncharacterized cupin superfamily protein
MGRAWPQRQLTRNHPPASKETAHRITNTGSKDLRYLPASTKLSPEIAEYPDSGKFGVSRRRVANAPLNGKFKRALDFMEVEISWPKLKNRAS